MFIIHVIAMTHMGIPLLLQFRMNLYDRNYPFYLNIYLSSFAHFWSKNESSLNLMKFGTVRVFCHRTKFSSNLKNFYFWAFTRYSGSLLLVTSRYFSFLLVSPFTVNEKLNTFEHFAHYFHIFYIVLILSCMTPF